MSKLEFKMNVNAVAEVRKIAFEETQKAFELDIKPAAVEKSPVTEEGMQHNIELHRRRPGGTGTNRRSIDVDTVDTPQGPHAEIYTQSGYGGYLEVGTARMRAQPYLYPAFVENIDKLVARIKARIGKRNIR